MPLDATAAAGTTASARRRAGRPVRMPVDPTPMESERFRAWPRSAWLHVTSRTVPAVVISRSELAQKLRAEEITADVSKISRWESGQHSVPPAVTAVYETATGLAPARLLAVSRSLARSSGHRSERAGLHQVPLPDHEDIDDVLDRALRPDSSVDGADWLAWATSVCAFGHFYMPPTAWQQVCDRLVAELALTRGVAHHRRHEACVTLLDHPVAQPHLLRAAGRWLTRRDVQVVTPVLSLLAEVDSPATADLVLKLLRSSSRRLRAGALGVATTQLGRGHLGTDAQRELETLCARRLSRTTSTSEALATLDLATHLPPQPFQRLVGALRHPGVRATVLRAREEASVVSEPTRRGIGRRLGWRAQLASMGGDRRTPEPDEMLDRLLQEALFHVHGWRRMLAGRILDASPYAAAVAEGVLHLTGDERPAVSLRAWELLGTLGHGGHTEELLDRALATMNPESRREALYAVSLAPRPLTSSEQDRVVAAAQDASSPDVRFAAVLTLGRVGPSGLAAVRGLDSATARAVAWWQGAGPMVQDRDTD